MTKPIGPKCNLRCDYCFYLEKDVLYPEQTQWVMSDEVLREHIRQTIEDTNAPEVSFTWQGGEPTLLGIEFFQKAINIQRELAHGKKITNSIQTNGTLLDDNWGAFLAHNGFLVGISIDGPAELHDGFRHNLKGEPTHAPVMNGLELLKKHKVEFNTLTVVNSLNGDHPLDVYRFLKEIGSQYMQFIPLVERRQPEASVGPEQFGEFLTAIYDQWIKTDVGRIFVQHFDVALNIWYGLPSPTCVFAETCGRAIVVEHNGDVYSCDHFVYPEYKLGNILETPESELVDSPFQGAFGLAKKQFMPKQCKECEVLFTCNGECPKHRFTETSDGEANLNYLCPSYKRFFKHIDPTMRRMVELLKAGRPPADIMLPAPIPIRPKVGRNDPCPCGSNKKFKHCCGAGSNR
jgi:uncharacterized protein